MMHPVIRQSDEPNKIAAAIVAMHLIRRARTPDNGVSAVALPASRDAAFIAGIDFGVDEGLFAR